MQAVILCAGKSTRTYPLTIEKPKPLLKVGNKTILEHNLEQLQGIADEAILVVNYKAEKIEEKIGEKFGKIKIRYILQEYPNGSGGAVMAAEKLVKDRFLVINGDDFYSAKDLKKCLEHKYCILAKETADIRNFGEVIREGTRVLEIKEKPKEKRKGMANIGAYLFEREIFSCILKKSERGEYELVDFIAWLVKQKKEVYYEEATDYWLPVGYPWDLLEANEYFLSNLEKQDTDSAKIEKGATIKGPACIGRDTVVKSGSYIEGPVMIGEGCSIGPNCYIRAYSSIGNNSKVGNAVEIKNSVIGDNVSVGHLSYVGDSVIGDNSNLGAGTITANLRHDNTNVKSHVKGTLVDTGRRKLGAIIGDSVHTGIHTSIYPGRKIWPGKSTLPGQVVKQDIS